MMDDFEKNECLKILELLTIDNLLSLTDTVTGRVVTVEKKEGTLNIQCVLKYDFQAFNSYFV